MTQCTCGSYAINDDPNRQQCDKCWRDATIHRLTAALAATEQHVRNLETLVRKLAGPYVDVDGTLALAWTRARL